MTGPFSSTHFGFFGRFMCGSGLFVFLMQTNATEHFWLKETLSSPRSPGKPSLPSNWHRDAFVATGQLTKPFPCLSPLSPPVPALQSGISRMTLRALKDRDCLSLGPKRVEASVTTH